jgi:selT/selW/selH-like putative selenoprotein
LDADAELIRGGGGIFDVHVDGKLVYSKFETHRFPDEDELVRSLTA